MSMSTPIQNTYRRELESMMERTAASSSVSSALHRRKGPRANGSGSAATAATAATSTPGTVCNFCSRTPAAISVRLPVLGRSKRASTPYCLSCYYTTSAVRQDPEKHISVMKEEERNKQLPAIQKLFSECFLELQKELAEESVRAFKKQKSDPLAIMLGFSLSSSKATSKAHDPKRRKIAATRGQAPDPRSKQEGKVHDGGFLREIDLPERLRRTQREQEELQARQLARMNRAASAARRASRALATGTGTSAVATASSSLKKRRKGSGRSIWNLAMDQGKDGKLATASASYKDAEQQADQADVSCKCGSKDVRSFGNVTSRNQEVRKGEIWGTDRGDEVVSRFQCNRCGRTWNEAE
mmetsp:Transcript_19435/g.45086  ORF Transcript_19435/g.45086 Transcript_19435/m.45086 type:complete len:356 (-) Transcript_19435:1075-2142(-)